MTILDVGCGSGKLTCDIARNVQQGSVVGLDNNTESLSKVREYAAAEGITNVNFIEGDILSLNYPDDAFDIVHARHVLHYVDALSALKEMRRVTKLGGIVAVREGARTIRWPIVKELEEFDEITRNILKGRGGNIETGAMFRGLAYEAEFEEKDVSIKASTRCLASNSQLGSYCSELPKLSMHRLANMV